MLGERTVEALAAMASARVLLGMTAAALEECAVRADRVETKPQHDGLWASALEPLPDMARELRNTAKTLDTLEDAMIREAMRP